MNKKGQIYGPDERPISSEEDAPPLPMQIQALVKAEVNTAMDAARQNLQREIGAEHRADSVKAWIRYALLLVLNAIVGILLWIYGPAELRKWTREFVAENMNRPTLDQAAKEVVASRMDAFANEKLRPLSKSVATLDNIVSDSLSTIHRLQEEQRLIAFVNRAETFDKDAFRELQALASGTNDIAPLAQAMLTKVQRTLILDRAEMSYLIPNERAGEQDYGGPFSNDELALRLKTSSPDGAVNIVGTEKRTIFIPRLVEIAHESKDLWTINRVAKALKNMGSVDFFPWDTAPLDKWWADNNQSYTNWPYSLYDEGNVAFGGCRYRDALETLNRLLNIDPAADRSRAMAIACAIEIGDTNQVSTLCSGFAQTNGRWDKWAQCRMLLDTGTVHAATEAFANLAKTYPTFTDSAWIRKGNHVLRKVDWVEYEKILRPDEKKASNNEMQPTR